MCIKVISVLKYYLYNTIQILLSTPHGGFSETMIKKISKKYYKLSIKSIMRLLTMTK